MLQCDHPGEGSSRPNEALFKISFRYISVWLVEDDWSELNHAYL